MRSVQGVARQSLIPPDPPLSDGEIVLRTRRETDVAAIARESYDPETRRRLNDEPLTPDRQGESVARVVQQWSTGAGAPFVIADAADDQPVGLLNLEFQDDDEVGSLAVSVFPEARGRGIAARALRLAAIWGLPARSRRPASIARAPFVRTARPTAGDTTA